MYRFPQQTGPLKVLAAAHCVLVVLDVENLHYSARDLGFRLNFSDMSKLILAANPSSALHAVLSVVGAMAEQTRAQAAAAGWIGHMRPIITSGFQRGANADNIFAFVVGHTVALTRPDFVVIGTGDGALGLDIARKIREVEPECRSIATLSFAHSTSVLLRAEHADEIDQNIFIGSDVLHAVRQA